MVVFGLVLISWSNVMTMVAESQGFWCTVLHICVLELLLSINFIKFYVIASFIDAIKNQY